MHDIKPGSNSPPLLASITCTLTERGQRYGKFTGHAEITQELKRTMRETSNWKKLSPDQQESLEMIAHKIGRILNGDPDYADSWHDIAGYAELIDKRLASGESL
jgi:hypothetical protein